MKLVAAGILRKGAKDGTQVWYYAAELLELANRPLEADSPPTHQQMSFAIGPD
jgi:hypothetical protein